jgi:nucleoside-diphosphate-sugar epimerase
MINSYIGMSCCVIGQYGFIGKTLSRRLKEMGAVLTQSPVKENKIIFNMSGPTHLQFEENPEYYTRETLNNFMNLMTLCQENDIRYIWPSSALVYEEDKHSPFIYCKKALEQLQMTYNVRSLALRIFPVFGVGEENKGEFKTIIYRWCEQMKNGDSPIVYGDGSQERDFIYIEDVVTNIIEMAADDSLNGVQDIGAGNPVSFNQVISDINDYLNKDIKPLYVDRPPEYSKGIVCQNPSRMDYDMKASIRLIMDSLNG